MTDRETTMSGDSATVAVDAGPVQGPVPTQAANTPNRDPVLMIVQYLAARWQRASGVDVLTSGLPLVGGKLPISLIEAALARVDLRCRIIEKSLGELSEFDLPVILAGTGRHGPLVLLERQDASDFLVFDPEADRERVIVFTRAETKQRQSLVAIAPVFDRMAGAAGRQEKRESWFRPLLAGHWRSIFHVALAASFINIFAIAFPLFTLNVYDRVLPNAATATLWVLASGLGIVLLFDFFLKIARGALIDHVGRRIDFRLASDLFSRVVNTRLESRPASTGLFINRITQYEVLRDFMTSSTLAIFVDFLFMGVFAYVIYVLIGWVVVFPLLAGLVSISLTVLIGIVSGKAVEASQAEAAARNAILVETLSSPQTVKALRAEGELLRRWEGTILASSETQNKIKWYQSLATNITATSSQISMVAIIIAGTYLFSEGEVSMGAIIASMMLSNRLIAPIGQIAGVLIRARIAVDAFRTLGSIMELPDERFVGRGFVERNVGGGRVEFRNVRFAYPGSNQFVLDGVSISIAPGEKVGIIGKIGSGKTTLGRLLVNFYTPDEGEILLDGVAISQYHPMTLRREVGLLIQEPELFAGTVRENILMAEPTAGEERLLAAAQRAGVDAFVARHPLGFDMPVGERGCLLSGGQRQAVALARTILSEPKVLFLDEPTSSMDLASERQLITHLSASLAPSHTVLIATHRYSLLSLVTRLIVIDNGRIRADGPRDLVLKQLQSGGQANDDA